MQVPYDLTRGSFKTIPASEETTNTQRFEAETWIRTMINGARVRDSGVELSPTGTDRRGGPRTADVMAHAADQTATFGQSGGMAWPTGQLATRPPGHPRPPMATFLFAGGPLLRIS